ncbi:Benzoyl-CoA reductase subunit BadG [hydrothermal vent metagenome]|uniref:Benzoyl-CoA reductase subunit BadG n=1 Tax=hydrothermal vent metagenome TaxID=652676 RepID=A0A3B0TID2_9ZZZZ
MIITAGVDIGSTYSKAMIQTEEGEIIGRAMLPTGFRLTEVAHTVYDEALTDAGLSADDIAYVIATGPGRHQVDFKDLQVTDLTASARGASFLFPGTRSILDIGGQTMKVSRIDEKAKVLSFRLNDKCAAGTGAFLEKTARYMGYSVEEISVLMSTSKQPVPISGVCAVFAESEVINHLSLGTAPADIMQGAIESLTGRSVQLMKRVRAEPEYTLIGGILRFETMGKTVSDLLEAEVNVPDPDMVQYVLALGCSILGRRRLEKLAEADGVPAEAVTV